MKKNLPDNIDTLLDQYFNDLDGDKPTLSMKWSLIL